MTLKLERKAQRDKSPLKGTGGTVLVTPPLSDEYWLYRVKLSDTQAILGFPKFGLVGIGFQEEEDWNTNLPSSCSAEEIFAHIARNKGDDSISDEDCLAAIRLIQEAASEDKS
jgi:hypothetical protein